MTHGLSKLIAARRFVQWGRLSSYHHRISLPNRTSACQGLL